VSGPESESDAALEASALARAADAGVHRVSVSTPFQVGAVNAYLIEDEPLTLIDSGPNSANALDELEQGLEALGHRVEDLQLLIVTHQHIDHFGLARILARRSGAEVAALSGLDVYLGHFHEQIEFDDLYAERTMLRHGIPADIIRALRGVSASFRGWGEEVQVTRALTDGEQLEFRDRTLSVIHRPGHSPSDTVFYDSERSMLIGADHLIKHISSNPLLARPLGEHGEYEGPRPKALVSYMASLRQTRAMELDLVLAGHGGPITEHRSLIDERFRMHDRRAEKIHGLVAERSLSAHEIAHGIWGNVAVTQAYLTLSEVLGHIDLLAAEGRVSEHEQDGVVRFAAT
jgi:glyoxylase-like metal-dependent hydrolase (beta-lactamase superfamily II)